MGYKVVTRKKLRLHSREDIYYIELTADKVVEHFRYNQDYIFPNKKGDFVWFIRDNVDRSLSPERINRIINHFEANNMLKSGKDGLQIVNFAKWEGEKDG